MAPRKPGKPKTPAVSRSTGSKNTGIGSKSGTRSRSVSKPGKKTRRGKKSKTRFAAYVVGAAAGLLLGAVGAVILMYRPQVEFMPKEVADQGRMETPAPAPSSAKKPAPAANSVAAPKVLYEENQVLERSIKQVDLLVYTTLGQMDVDEERVGFLDLTPRVQGGHHWDQATIQVELPPGLEAERALKGLQKALIGSRLRPEPKLAAEAIE